MPNYEIDAEQLSAKNQKKLADIALEIVFDPESGRLFGRADDNLPRGEGIREVSDADFDAVANAGRSEPISGGSALPDGTRLEASRQWKVAASSPRKAKLHWIAAGGDEQALGVELGTGRGDRIEIVRPLPVGLIVKSVSLDVLASVDLAEEFGIAVTLTSASERPWLERGPDRAEPKTWTTLTFDFSDVDDAKLVRVDQLILSLRTDADEGLCMIKNVSLMG